MSYIQWNDILVKHFFHEGMAGREVLLYLDKQLIEELGQEINQSYEDFLKCVLIGPEWWIGHKPSGICKLALLALRNWRKRGLTYPPYIAYLALFVLAANMDNERFSEIAYYPKLLSLLDKHHTVGQVAYFDQMYQLWSDLASWSRDDKLEELGRFTLIIRGNNRHVGIPFSQTILSDKERKKLPLLFNTAHLVAPATPNDNLFRSILITNGQNVFSQKTLRLLKGQENNYSLLQALLNLIREELNNWDGSIPEGIAIPTNDRKVNSLLKVCLNLDKLSRKVRLTLRILSNHEFPEEKLLLKRRGDNQIVSCEGSTRNWSFELRDQQDQLVNPGPYLLDNQLFEAQSVNWRARFEGRAVRVFTKGSKFGVNNHYVETEGLEKSGQFLILTDFNQSIIIRDWGQKECERFEQVNYDGIPHNWFLFAGLNARNSCPHVDELAIRNEGRAILVDGLRIGKGNVFLHSKPPKVILENMRGTVRLKGKLLPYNEETEQWELSGALPVNESITVKICNEEEQEISKLTFQLIEPRILIRDIDMYLQRTEGFDRSGLNFIGVHPLPESERKTKPYQSSFPGYLSFEMILLGKHPGQLIHWTKQKQSLENWQPVWALIKHGRNHWELKFCSMGAGIMECTLQEPEEDEKQLTQWKEAIVYMNKFVTESTFTFPALKELWQSYLGVAGHA